MFNLLTNVYGNVANPNENLSEIKSFGAILGMVANFTIAVAFSLAIISIAYASLQYIMSAGDPKAIQKGTTGMIWGAVAAAGAFLVIAFKNVVINSLGVTNPHLVNNVPGF